MYSSEGSMMIESFVITWQSVYRGVYPSCPAHRIICPSSHTLSDIRQSNHKMQFPATQLARLALLIACIGTVIAYNYNPSIGRPKCNTIASGDSDFDHLECTTATLLQYCNAMCTYQGERSNFWPGQWS